MNANHPELSLQTPQYQFDRSRRIVGEPLWNRLVQIYALRAREVSDTVAQLGQLNHPGVDSLDLLEEIKKRQALCIAAGVEIEQYLERTGHLSDRLNEQLD